MPELIAYNVSKKPLANFCRGQIGLKKYDAVFFADALGVVVPEGNLHLADVRLAQKQHGQTGLTDTAAHGQGQFTLQQLTVEGKRAAVVRPRCL